MPTSGLFNSWQAVVRNSSLESARARSSSWATASWRRDSSSSLARRRSSRIRFREKMTRQMRTAGSIMAISSSSHPSWLLEKTIKDS
jgi:hypothetical protein